MERMGDILARTASRRARPTRPTDSAASPADSAPPVVGATVVHQRASGGRPRPPSGDSAGQPNPPARTTPVPPRALPARATGPARSVVTRPLAQPDLVETPPGIPSAVGRISGPADVRPDVLAGDRILELPPRRATAVVRASASAGGGQDPAPSAPRRTPPPDTLAISPRGEAADVNHPRDAARFMPTGGRNGSPLRETAGNYMSDAPARLGHAASSGAAPCPICNGAGYVRLNVPLGDPAFGVPEPCECKKQQKRDRDRREMYQLSGLDVFSTKTFDTFDPNVQGVEEAFKAAHTLAVNPEPEGWRWLVLSGPHGAGKTHLAAAIANYQFSQGLTVFFSIVPDLLDHLRATFAPSSEVPYDELFDRIREAGLLVLDDLGAENGTAWATEKLFQIINHRYNVRYPTVITTNARLLSQMDDRIRSRLSDLSLVRHCVIQAQDYRERHIANRARRPGGRSDSSSRGGPSYGHSR